MHVAWRACGGFFCRGSMTTTPASSSAHVIPVFANSLSRIACGRSHTMPVPADNTRIIFHSLVHDIGHQPGFDIVLWLAKLAVLATFISNPHSAHGPRYSWFARLPSTRVAHFAFQEPPSSHCSFVRAVIVAEIWRVFMRCFAGHRMSFFGSRSWLFVPVSRVPSSVIHGQRPRRRFQVLAGQLTGSTCVNLDQSLRSVLFVPSHISGAGQNFGHGLSAALGDTELASSGGFEGPRVRSYLVCVFLLAVVCSSCSPAAVSIHLQVGGFTQSVVSSSARVLHLVLCHVHQCRCRAATI